MRGTIASVAFGSGDRFVAGIWDDSPLGAIADVMWARPDGRRILLAPDEAVGRFVSSVYGFDEVRTATFAVEQTRRSLRVRAGEVAFELRAGAPRPLPFPRPWWVTRRLERPIAGALMGVRTFGVSPSGVREWYQARSWRNVRAARGTVDGHDLGAPLRRIPATHFGFSEPPPRPTVVRLRVALEFPR
jgi:hypothetical protein